MDRFRFQFCPAIELGNNFHISGEYRSYETAKLGMNAVANYTLDCHKFHVMKDYSNCCFIEQFHNNEWVSFDD